MGREHLNHHQNKYQHSNRRLIHDEIISVKSGTLISKRKEVQHPVFYDPEHELAKAVKNINRSFVNTMFDENEKQKLIHIEECNLIRDYTLRIERNGENADSDGNPVTPTASDSESDHDDVPSIKFGAMKNNKVRNIWDATKEFSMFDENGTNLLNNDDMEQYGIYNKNGIKYQAMQIPDDAMIDGQFLMDNAQIIHNKKKKKNGNHHTEKRKKRRSKKKKHKHQKLSKEEMDQKEAQELVAYLDMIRNQRT